MEAMLWLVAAYLGSSLAATMVYVDVAHRLPLPAELDAEAEWWQAFTSARRRLGYRPSHADVLRELQAA